MNNKQYAVIVDAFSSGSSLPKRFQELGFTCLHVLSSATLPSFYQKKAAPAGSFEHEFVFDGDIESLLKKVLMFNFKFVIAGTESGVLLADQLAEALKCPGNGTQKSSARRNKFLMSETLRAQEVPAVRQKLCTSLEDAISWASQQNSWPLVIKPVDSAGSDGFSLVNNVDELSFAASKLISSLNFMGELNNTFLIQECLQGVEYMVNTVGWKSNHQVTDIWRVQKKIAGTTKTYDFEDLVSPSDKVYSVLSEYIVKVLNALEIDYGPAHSEVMFTPKGPVLIETGARLCGGLPSSVGQSCHAISQLDLTVAAYTGSDQGFKETSKKWLSEPAMYSRCVTLLAPFSGKVAREPDFSSIKTLPSFHSISTNLELGSSELIKTIDLATSPGLVFLVHSSVKQLEEDYEKIRHLEATTLYSFVDRYN